MKKRLFVLALDGVPCSHLQKWLNLGWMPRFAAWLEQNNVNLQAINSVMPPVSSSAWASFMTGKSPHGHGIYSFTERDPATMEWFTPQADSLKSPTIFEHLSGHGKRVFVMNVPVTYPPRAVNGISICGFLHDDVRTGTWPSDVGNFLAARDYRIDADTSLAKSDLKAFIADLKEVLEKRIETMWHFLRQEKWDLFMAHIMEPDRLQHFTFEYYEQGLPGAVELYRSFYRRLDKLIGEIVEALDDDVALMLLSDHGFGSLKQEVYLNRWLWEKGWLRFTRPVPQSLQDINPQSIAYALYPGRVFINLQGREKTGSVSAAQYIMWCDRIAAELKKLGDPQGHTVVADVRRASAIYPGLPAGSSDIAHRAIADLFVLAHPGYDLKGSLWHDTLFDKSVFNGMHTFDNAFLAADTAITKEKLNAITDIAPHLCRFLGVPEL